MLFVCKGDFFNDEIYICIRQYIYSKIEAMEVRWDEQEWEVEQR